MRSEKIKSEDIKAGYLEGQLLVATPQIRLSCFEKSVIYLCVHNSDGAMGIIVNQAIFNIQSSELLRYLDIDIPFDKFKSPVYFGGPVEPGKGFILHNHDYKPENTLTTKNGLSVTSNIDILEDIAVDKGPKDSLIALGYAGWSANQLEMEIEANGWFTVPLNKELVFGVDNASKWKKACKSVGVNPYMIAAKAGHA